MCQRRQDRVVRESVGPRASSAAGELLNRQRLARECRLLDVEIARFQYHGISRHKVAGGETDEVAGHYVAARDFLPRLVATDSGRQGNLFAQSSNGLIRADRLHALNRGADRDDQTDHNGARNLAQPCRNQGRYQQNQRQRI